MSRLDTLRKIIESLKPTDIEITFADSRPWVDGERIPEHEHPDLYQIDLIHGEGEVTLGPQRLILRRWALIFIPPRIVHSFYAAAGGNFRNVGIKAAVKCAALAQTPAFCLITGANHRVDQIQRDLQSILHESQSKTDASRLLIQTRCMSVLLECVRMWTETENPIASHGVVQDACHYMALHYSHDLTVSQLAKHCGVQPESLCRAFRRTMHVPPRRYLIDLRIRQARALLEAGVSVTETARQTGFTSIHYFSRAFTKFAGISPRQWMQNARQPTQ